uniref:Uncharacterized protein n=1 Tax=Arundo donax TaxID=35708 RepID=A0A0A9BX23_ARUDO
MFSPARELHSSKLASSSKRTFSMKKNSFSCTKEMICTPFHQRREIQYKLRPGH